MTSKISKVMELAKNRINYHITNEKTIGDVLTELNAKQLQLIDRLVSQASSEFCDKDPFTTDKKAWAIEASRLWVPCFLDLTSDQQAVACYLIRLAASEAYAKAFMTQNNEKTTEEDRYHVFMKKARDGRHDDLPWFGGVVYGTKARIPLLPTKIIFSGPKCIVFWNDRSKTIVSRSENDPYDEHAAFCAAYAKRMFGSTARVKKMVNRIAVGYPDKEAKVK